MHIPKNDKLLNNARKLRKDMTPQELRLWYRFLRPYPVKVYKQRIIGEYIVDFYCASARLVIEIDGSQHYEDAGKAYDTQRTAYFESLGLKVIRYSNRDINCSFDAVCEHIDQVIQERRALSAPLRGHLSQRERLTRSPSGRAVERSETERGKVRIVSHPRDIDPVCPDDHRIYCLFYV